MQEAPSAGQRGGFEAALQGSIIVNQMRAGKQRIGYLGDMPALSTTKRQQSVIKPIANTGYSPGQRCNVITVRTDAPEFKADSGSIARRGELIERRPDIVQVLEAQRFVLDPKNATKVAEIVKSPTSGITVPMAWLSLYGAIAPAAGGTPARDEKRFVFDERVHKQPADIYKFLHEIKVIDVDKAPQGALDDSLARKVTKSAAAPLLLGTIQAQDVSRAPKQ